MKKIFHTIWDAALPYQDKRDDAGHAFLTLEYAKQLVDLDRSHNAGIEKAAGAQAPLCACANPDVVLPAIILHDTGWSKLTREERFLIFNPARTREQERQVRFKHQDEGVRIASEVLAFVDYPAELAEEILEIISQHDTREEFLSHNEGLVRDADKLWRFSKTGFDADVERFAFAPDFLHDKLHGQICAPGFFYGDHSRVLAGQELARRKAEYQAWMPAELTDGTIDAAGMDAAIADPAQMRASA